MMGKVLLEVCCGSADDVIQAHRAGADRVELNSDLFHGGLTPTIGELLVAKRETGMRIMAMVRPREGGFCYTQAEFDTAIEDAKLLLHHGADGLVFGFLHPDGTIDLERTRVLAELAPILAGRRDRFILCSMAAGLSMDQLLEMAGGDFPVIRILPNTPAAIGQGVAQFCVRGVTAEENADFLTLLAPSGLLDEMDEKLMTAANCISGCGTAFCAMLIEALADGAVACGLPRDKALATAAQTLAGAGALCLAQGVHPGAMKDAVCSPGGTTIQGVRALEERGFRAAAMDAVIAAYEKTLKLARK